MVNGKSGRLSVVRGEEESKLDTWLEMARASYLIERKVVGTLAPHSLTLPQFDVLATLRFSEGVSQQELALRLLVSKGNVCGVLDRLEGFGFVVRKPHPTDTRANTLHLTPTGKRKIDAVLPDHDKLLLHIMRNLTEQETELLGGLLGKLESGMND